MLYPTGAPLISEFKAVLEHEYGCVFKHDQFKFDDGIVFDYHYIERDFDGEKLIYPIADYSDDMRVHGLLLLSICRYLRLDCTRWGVTLTHWEDLPED